VELLGFKGKMKWTQDDKGLAVELPEQKPCDHAIALKIAL
jgi:alpha-L-fucosidase